MVLQAGEVMDVNNMPPLEDHTPFFATLLIPQAFAVTVAVSLQYKFFLLEARDMLHGPH